MSHTAATTVEPVAANPVPVRQYTRAGVLGVWAAAAVPMGLLAWVVAPAVAGPAPSAQGFALTLISALAAGLIWQFVLVVALVAWEQRDRGWSALRWSTLREALWLRAPSDPRDRRRGGRLWWWALAAVVLVAVLEQIPYGWDGPDDRNFGSFLSSADGQAMLPGNWGLFGLCLVVFLFNTVLGEELLFRGLLLPRMRAAFGKGDWVANTLLFGLYHLHQPWSIPSGITTGLVLSYTTRRWRSAWLGIIAHSGQSVFFTILLFALVVS